MNLQNLLCDILDNFIGTPRRVQLVTNIYKKVTRLLISSVYNSLDIDKLLMLHNAMLIEEYLDTAYGYNPDFADEEEWREVLQQTVDDLYFCMSDGLDKVLDLAAQSYSGDKNSEDYMEFLNSFVDEREALIESLNAEIDERRNHAWEFIKKYHVSLW